MNDPPAEVETIRRATIPRGWTEEADTGTMHGALPPGRL